MSRVAREDEMLRFMNIIIKLDIAIVRMYEEGEKAIKREQG